jgi:predicted GTPase
LDDLTHREVEPVRILVAGQTSAGKSSLINALANAIEAAVDVLPTTTEFAAYRLRRENTPAALLIDSPGLAAANGFAPLVGAADNCDMLLWVISAARAARDLDRRGLAIIRTHFSSAAARSQPPIVVVLTHVDNLRPFGEWAPPYDIASAVDSKARSIRAAMDAASQELGVDMSRIVPVRVDSEATSYNVDALWAKIMELMPDAQRARLLRTIDDANRAISWRAVWSQAVGAGRVIKETFLSRSLAP